MVAAECRDGERPSLVCEARTAKAGFVLETPVDVVGDGCLQTETERLLTTTKASWPRVSVVVVDVAVGVSVRYGDMLYGRGFSSALDASCRASGWM